MGLPKNLSFCRIGSGGQTLDVYLDFLCPFSRKMAHSLNDNVVPLITKGGKYEGQVQLLVRPYPQPFHYYSTFPVEACIVFGQEHPQKWWDYVLAAFAIQEDWYNRPAADKTAQQCQTAYATVAAELAKGSKDVGSADVGKFMEKLGVHEKNNGGSEAFDELKYFIKVGRQNGIHVTPTVLVNDLEDSSVSSSFGKAEWDKFFAEKL